MLRLDVIEKLMNVEMLFARLRVETNAQYHDVELVQEFWTLFLLKEKIIYRKQAILPVINHQTR